ncbi:MAG: radical SAM protein [Alloprevotella sp.]|nr:radical SAM protein [Alloprevotella sp.]
MDIYRLLKVFGRVKSPRLRLLGLWWLHVTGRRYLGVFLDPVLMCNLRCRMCYFSDGERRRELHGKFEQNELERIAQAFLPRALKLQIGCGAEPTLSPHLAWLVAEGKRLGVPYVSVTTNGMLLDEALLRSMAQAGLDELTISLHGLTRQTYEHLMAGATWDGFKGLLEVIAKVRRDFPTMKLRVNYTLNTDNVKELALFDEVFADVRVDVLQLRPVQRIGNTAYQDFSMRRIEEVYDAVLLPLAARCKARGTRCLLPTRENLHALEDGTATAKSGRARLAEEAAYCNITPGHVWRDDFDPDSDTYDDYARRHRFGRRLLRLALGWGSVTRPEEGRTRKLNYTIQ